jgi:YidC/Oxa1 family membrane protein insertase
MEPRRVALAVVLMALVLVGVPLIFPNPPAPVANGTSPADSAATVTAAAPAAPAAGAPQVAAPQGAAMAAADSAPTPALEPVDTTTVATPLATYRTTSLGGALIGAELHKYQQLTDGGRGRAGTVQLARAGDPLLRYRLVVPGDTIALDGVRFRRTEGTATAGRQVRYDATVAGRAVSLTYTFLPDSYRVNVAATVAAAVPGTAEKRFLVVALPSAFRSSEADTTEDHNHLAYAYKVEQQGAEGVPFRDLDPGERKLDGGPITWAVAKNKYFLVGLLTPAGAPGFAEVGFTGGVRTGKEVTQADGQVVMPLADGAVAFEVYAGPQEFTRLVAMGREFETSNPYGGWMQGMVQPFATMVIRMLLWMKATLGVSYGWLLVIFGVLVRVVLWPLNQKAMRSSIQMQRVQPELQAVQAKHKGDPQRMQAEIMRVYKEHGMSPFSSLSGCLPMLIPMPVFIALFFVFQNTIEFRGVPFLWFPDISVKDPYYIIPVLVAATTMLMSWIGMRGIQSNEQQKMMLYLMPGIMLVFFFSMASGLNLYYFVQNVASLPQQWLIAQERKKGAGPVVQGPART